MPRLSTALLRQARSIDPLLLPVLRICRDLPSARNELRWLREHVSNATATTPTSHGALRKHLAYLCDQRGRGRPLQYILGSEFFGELEIKCRDGVFIPRQETAAAVTYLAKRLAHDREGSGRVRVIDVCTGTGAMSLLFAHCCEQQMPAEELAGVDVLGIDVSRAAVKLARENASCVRSEGLVSPSVSLRYTQTDLFSSLLEDGSQFDVILCNPPYISAQDMWRDTARSVRVHEPRTALTPTGYQGAGTRNPEDVFYHKVISELVGTVRAKTVLFEVAHMAQAVRVVVLAQQAGWECEIWRDWPELTCATTEHCGETGVRIRGSGHGRSVYMRRPI